jgi:hypothetical protein
MSRARRNRDTSAPGSPREAASRAEPKTVDSRMKMNFTEPSRLRISPASRARACARTTAVRAGQRGRGRRAPQALPQREHKRGRARPASAACRAPPRAARVGSRAAAWRAGRGRSRPADARPPMQVIVLVRAQHDGRPLSRKAANCAVISAAVRAASRAGGMVRQAAGRYGTGRWHPGRPAAETAWAAHRKLPVRRGAACRARAMASATAGADTMRLAAVRTPPRCAASTASLTSRAAPKSSAVMISRFKPHPAATAGSGRIPHRRAGAASSFPGW